jgi:hypothetical protein
MDLRRNLDDLLRHVDDLCHVGLQDDMFVTVTIC